MLRDFDMGLPSLPKTVPVITHSVKAVFPVNFLVNIIIREIHKNMMSLPVISTLVGTNVSRSSVAVTSPFQPKVENAQSPLENQVSKTSWS